MESADPTLESIFNGCNGLIEIRPLPPSPDYPARFFLSVAEARAYAATLDGVRDCYFGAATRKRESGTKNDVQELGALWADCDTAESVSNLAAFPFRPSCEVETSPGRRHCWWLLREPLELEGKAAEDAEAVLRGIAEFLKSDGSVAEVARIMRVPGTTNVKRGAPCKLLYGGGPRYNLSDFVDVGLYKPRNGTAKAAMTASAEGVIPNGKRNTTLVSLAGTMRRRGMTAPEIKAALAVANKHRCNPPLDDAEVEVIAASVGRYAPQPDAEPVRLTDAGNAILFVRQHGDYVRYVPERAVWLVWDGTAWRPDTTGAAMRLAKETAKTLYLEAAQCNDGDTAKLLAKHAGRSGARYRLEAMIALAWSEPGVAVKPSELDADPWLFNATNGTIDLKTGKLRPHRKQDHITKICGCAYDPDAKAPEWDDFLAEIMQKDTDLVDYLQRCAGYSMTGSVREHKLFLPHGEGRNGKSTFLRALRQAFGDYSDQAPPDLLLMDRNDRHPTGMADLEGLRLVTAIETDQGRRLGESMVKALTGGDAIKARRMRQDYPRAFEPTHKLWLAVNHLPVVRGQDAAIWSRIVRMPFEARIDEAEIDRELDLKLAAELPGILAWCVRGCLAWQKDGLEAPEAVKRATEGYREDSDIIGDFLAEACIIEPGAETTRKELYGAFVTWCEKNGEKPGTQKELAALIRARSGVGESRDRKTGRGWLNIKLAPFEPPKV